VLKVIFEPKRDEITSEWKRLHNEEVYELYSSTNNSRAMKSRNARWAGYVASMGDSSGAYRVLMGKREGKRQPGRPRNR
jgi:hypothetical protein